MTFVFSAFTVIYLVGLAASITAAALTYPDRSAPGGRWLFLMSVAAGAWSLAEAFDYSVTTLGAHIVAGQFSYLGATTAPVLLLLFTLEYSGRVRRPMRSSAALFFIVPMVVTGAAFTNSLHHLVWPGFSLQAGHPNIIVYQHGPLYWLVVLYSLAVAALATLLLLDTAIHSQGIYRSQSVALFVATLFPWAAELGYSLAPGTLPGLDPAAAAGITCAILAFTITKYQLLDLVAVTREELVDEMTVGLVVLDREGRVLETNPAAVRLLGIARAPRPGTLGIDVFAEWTEEGRDAAVAVYEDRSATLESPTGTYIGVERSHLGAENASRPRDLFILRDITVQVKAERELQDAYATLESRMAEIQVLQGELLEQATRDPLTGLHNRRYLAEELERELGRASREGYPVSVVMFDVDRFKDVNDTCGHGAGDEMLLTIAAELTAQTRRGDVTCRYGGDEFVVVLPNAGAECALIRAEGWRTRLRDVLRDARNENVAPSVSLGVATYPIHGTTIDTLVAAADRAVYASKDAGRDCVSLATVLPHEPAQS